MKSSKPGYKPWERTDSTDDGIQQPLDEATPEQSRGMIRKLRRIADQRKEQNGQSS